MNTNDEVNKLEDRLDSVTTRLGYIFRFFDITLNKIPYTNQDIDVLIRHFESIEKYELCNKLSKFRK